MKKIAVIQTSLVSYEELNRLFAEVIPEAKIVNIIDDSLLDEVSKNGRITPCIVSRMCKYFENAQSIGADLIFSQCSSVGEAALLAAQTVSVPLLRIDEAMAEKAVALGGRIGVIASVGSTVEPSCNLIKEKAASTGRQVEIIPCLVDGALDVLMREGRERHNALIMDAVRRCEETCDVIVLAQGSMSALLPCLTAVKKPVLTSPESGVRKARQLLFGNA